MRHLENNFHKHNDLLYAAINPEPHFRKKGNPYLPSFSQVKRYWPLLFIPFAFWLGNHFKVVFNQSDSLPQKVWVMSVNQKLKRHDYIAFKPSTKSKLPSNLILHKQVLGIAGDVVTKMERDFFINGQYVATAKTHSLKGEPLRLGPVGTLKEGQYYVSTPHKDSFDSRYEKMGWIDGNNILGVLYPLW